MLQVLLVDDDRSVCRCLKTLIPWAELGCAEPEIAYNGAEAIQRIEQKKPDIMISDIRMPMMNGVSLCQEVKRRFPDISILFFSAYEDFVAAQVGMQAGVRGYILKPVNRKNLKELETAVQEIVASKRQWEIYEMLLTSGNDREQIFSHLKKLDEAHFAQLFHEWETYLGEAKAQTQILSALYLQLLHEYMEHFADVEYSAIERNRSQAVKELAALSTPREQIHYVRQQYQNLCRQQAEHREKVLSKLVTEVTRYITEHYGDPQLNVSAVADRFHLSPDHLGRIFSAETGTTVSSYIMDTRISEASKLLRESTVPINDIAAVVGYGDANYFAKVFRRKMGLAPSEYRKMLRRAEREEESFESQGKP